MKCKVKGTYFSGLGTWSEKDMKIWREEWRRAALDDALMSNPDIMAVTDEVAHCVLMRICGVRHGE